jgi:hypothetical protein
MREEARGKRQAARDKRPEVKGKRREARGERQETRDKSGVRGTGSNFCLILRFLVSFDSFVCGGVVGGGVLLIVGVETVAVRAVGRATRQRAKIRGGRGQP